MADQQNTPSGNSPQASSNTFNKGMFKDFNDTFVGEGIYTHARNGVNNSHDGQVGVIGNEPSNFKCITLKYRMIGCIHLLDDQWVIFSTDDTNSEIGIFDESECSYAALKNNQGQDIDFGCLNFKTTNLITGVFRKRYDCERLIYWDDGLNPTRTMDIDKIPCIQNCTNPTPNCTVCVDTIYLDCEKIRIAPIVDHPCISVAKGKLPGTLPNGSYQACIAYTVNELRVTDYIGLTEVQGIWSHENTSGSLDVTITHIDSTFNEFELVLLSNINAQTTAKRIGYYNTSRGQFHIDRWDTELINVPVGDIVFRSEPIDKSDAMYTVNNYLLRVGTYSKFKFNYQPLANQITANWLAVEYPKNYYQKGGNNTSYMRDEVYAFFIRFVYNTGEFSESYHIPGRPKSLGIDDAPVAGLDVYEAANLPKWQVYNTAFLSGGFSPYQLPDGGRVVAQGSMGYWESGELYPSDKSGIWNSFPNVPSSPYNLCGQPIRHHKMPDETIGGGILDLYNNTNDTVRLLGVKFNNIQHPVDNAGNLITTIVGYEILRGSREGNKTIIAKGLINNMRDYSIPGNSNTGLFVNYPYNDLRADPYLFDANSGTARPDGYNGDFWGGDYTGNKMNSYKRDVFSFHSPDTTFSKPYLNAAELKLYREHIGTANGMFQVPYKHPKSKFATGFVSVLTQMINTINTLEALSSTYSSKGGFKFTGTEDMPVEFNYAFPDFPTWPAITGADAYGASSIVYNIIAGILYAALIVIYVAEMAALLILSLAMSSAKTQKLYDIFFAIIPKKSFAAQYTSHGLYNSYQGIGVNNTRRNVLLANYIGGGVQQFGLNYQINNVNRGSGDIVVQLGNPIQPTNKDNSRVITSEVNVGYDESFNTNIASYYGALRIPMQSQYGQIESIKQLPVSTCITNIYNTSTGTVPLFGGDVYINRFTQKNTMFFFNTWLLGQPDMYEFNYCNYINIPYPRWWANSEAYKVTPGTGPTESRSLDNTTTIGNVGINSITSALYVKSGYFYLFNSGVRDFFCESEVNLAYRDYEDNDIAKRFYDPYGFASISGESSLFRSDPGIISAGNYYKYDYALSKSKLFNSHITWGETLPRDYDPFIAASCYVYRPNRVIYSIPQQDGSKKDNWRAFLPNNYKDFPSKVSSIKPVNKTGALFMMKYANPLQFMGVEELKLSESGTKVTIGDGALFSSGGVSQLQSVVNSDESYEYGSNQSRFSSINCLHGVFWVSQNQGKIFQYGGGAGLQEISGGGMRWWFAKYLPSELLKQWPNYPYYDNPVMGVGTQMIYDNTHELIYITKRDYIPKDCGQTLNYNGNFTNRITVAPDSCPEGSSLVNGVCVPNVPQCPEGYIYDAAQNLCVDVQTVSPILNSSATNLTKTPYYLYGVYGTLVHDTPVIAGPSTLIPFTNAFWVRQPFNPITGPYNPPGWYSWSAAAKQAYDENNGPVNRLSIWGIGDDGIIRNNYNGYGDVPPIGQWIGFDVCVNIPEEKTYWVGVAADNAWRISIDGNILLQDLRGDSLVFYQFNIYPLTLPAGNHILKLEGENDGQLAGFGCEIYDLSSVATTSAQVVTYLSAQTNYTNLDPLILFTTRGQTTFTSNLYSCPTGFGLSNPSCDEPICQRTLTVAPTYTASAARQNVQVIAAPWDNKECWEEVSWTISYDPKIKAWVSFHDWIPSFLIPGRSHFMSVAPQSGSIVDSIWKHNIRCDSYCNYYGVDYPFEIEFVSATGQTVNSMRSIEYLLEAYNYSNDCRDKFHNYYENFDQAIVYNSEQISGLLMLNLHTKNDPLALLAYPKINTALGYIDIQYSKVENKFRFNQFWDITNNRGQNLPSPLNLPMFNTEGNGYKYPINPAYVNYSKNPLEHKKFRHNVNRVFLRRLVSGNNKFLFKLSNQKLLQSPR